MTEGVVTGLLVESPGLQAVVQDRGRDLQVWGVGRSGAADRAALALANRLVGNGSEAAGLECLLGGLRLRALGTAVVTVTGADCPVLVDAKAVDSHRALLLADGQTLSLGTARTGLRAYVGVRGGIAVPQVLGSRSRDLLGGIGPDPLVTGMMLPIGSDTAGSAWFEPVAPPQLTRPVTVRASPGPRTDWFSPHALDALSMTEWTVRGESDRTGLRLAGAPLQRRSGDLPSEPTIPGAIQVPPDGQPIILGPDSGVSGGYPVIAVVLDQDLDALAQMRTGEPVRICWA